MKHNYRYLNYVGDSAFDNRFASTEEMKEVLTRLSIEDPEGNLDTAGMPLISDTQTVYADTQDYHTLVLGSTGSMKSRTLILPTILTLAMAGENMVIADPKGELYDATSGYLKHRGYKINVLNLRDMTHSDCWNPLAEAYYLFHHGKEEEGLGVAHEFINALSARVADSKSPSWAIAARQLLDGLVELMIRGAKDESECNPGSLSTLLDRVKLADRDPETPKHSPFRFGQDDDDEPEPRSLLDFVNALPEGCSIKNSLFSAVNMTRSANATLAGVLDCAYGSVSAFTTSRALLALTAKTTFDLHDFASAENKHALYLVIPDEDTTYHFVATSFIKQLYTTMIKESYARHDGALPRRLNFLLDEFANLPYISDMPSMITAARSRNMRFFLVVQSDNQLRSTYKDDAETIKTNCLNWVYLSTKEDQLILQIQRMVGIRGNGSNEPLISYQELSAMRKVVGEKGGADALILMHRCRPFVSFMPDISRYKQFTRFPAVKIPSTKSSFTVFDLVSRVLILSEEEAEKQFGLDKMPAIEPEPEEKKAPEQAAEESATAQEAEAPKQEEEDFDAIYDRLMKKLDDLEKHINDDNDGDNE